MNCKDCGVPIGPLRRRGMCDRCRENEWGRKKSSAIFVAKWGTPEAPKRKCDHCKKPYLPQPNGAHFNRRRFCSVECKNLAKRDERPCPGEFSFVTECEVCERPIDFETVLPTGRRLRRDSTLCGRSECKRAQCAAKMRVWRGTKRYMSSLDALDRRRYRGRALQDPTLLTELLTVIKERKGGSNESMLSDPDAIELVRRQREYRSRP